jgi:hypothetical protein
MLSEPLFVLEPYEKVNKATGKPPHRLATPRQAGDPLSRSSSLQEYTVCYPIMFRRLATKNKAYHMCCITYMLADMIGYMNEHTRIR